MGTRNCLLWLWWLLTIDLQQDQSFVTSMSIKEQDTDRPRTESIIFIMYESYQIYGVIKANSIIKFSLPFIWSEEDRQTWTDSWQIICGQTLGLFNGSHPVCRLDQGSVRFQAGMRFISINSNEVWNVYKYSMPS